MEFLTLAFLLGLWSEENYLYSTVSAVCALGASVLFVVMGKMVRGEKERRLLGGTALCFLCFLCGVVRGQFIEAVNPESLVSKNNQNSFTAMVKGKDADEKSVVYTLGLLSGEEMKVRVNPLDEYILGDIVFMSPPWKEGGEVMSLDQKTLRNSFGSHGMRMIVFPQVTKVDDVENMQEFSEIRESISFRLTLLREKIAHNLNTFVPGRAGDLASGTLFGSSYLTKSEELLFREAGISHIVALSGFNIAIVIAFLLVVLRYVPYVIRATLLSFSVAFYVLLVDMTGSLLRATLMASLSGALLLFGYKGDEKKVLCFSLFILTVVSPSTVLTSVSLHLSYLALVGVMYVYPLFFEKIVDRYVGFRYAVLLVFFESLAVSMLVIPYSTLVFQSLTIVGILTTVLVSPLVPILTILSLVTALLALFVPFGASLLAPILFALCQLVYAVAEVCVRLPFGTFTHEGSSSVVAVYVLCLVLVARFLTVKRNERESFLVDEKDGQKEFLFPDEAHIIRGTVRY